MYPKISVLLALANAAAIATACCSKINGGGSSGGGKPKPELKCESKKEDNMVAFQLEPHWLQHPNPAGGTLKYTVTKKLGIVPFENCIKKVSGNTAPFIATKITVSSAVEGDPQRNIVGEVMKLLVSPFGDPANFVDHVEPMSKTVAKPQHQLQYKGCDGMVVLNTPTLNDSSFEANPLCVMAQVTSQRYIKRIIPIDCDELNGNGTNGERECGCRWHRIGTTRDHTACSPASKAKYYHLTSQDYKMIDFVAEYTPNKEEAVTSIAVDDSGIDHGPVIHKCDRKYNKGQRCLVVNVDKTQAKKVEEVIMHFVNEIDEAKLPKDPRTGFTCSEKYVPQQCIDTIKDGDNIFYFFYRFCWR